MAIYSLSTLLPETERNLSAARAETPPIPVLLEGQLHPALRFHGTDYLRHNSREYHSQSGVVPVQWPCP